MSNLALVEQRTINNVLVDGYYRDKDAWFSREQIGSALGYSHPRIAIGKIHNKHKERLDKFSTVTKTVNVDGKEREIYIYCLRGVLEICRWSKQSVADMVMDKLYEMAISVIDKGYYSMLPDEKLVELLVRKRLANPNSSLLSNKGLKFAESKIVDTEKSECYKTFRKAYEDKRELVKKYRYTDEYEDRMSEIDDWVENERQNKFKHLSTSDITLISNKVMLNKN